MRKLTVAILFMVASFFVTTPVSASEIDPAVQRYLATVYAREAALNTWRFLGAQQWELDIADCFMRYESGYTPWAVNSRTRDYGMFQVNRYWWEENGGLYVIAREWGIPDIAKLAHMDRYNPYINAVVARVIWTYAYNKNGLAGVRSQWMVARLCGI
jgi:hypothetical protein